jgi:hypothetical protein
LSIEWVNGWPLPYTVENDAEGWTKPCNHGKLI